MSVPVSYKRSFGGERDSSLKRRRSEYPETDGAVVLPSEPRRAVYTPVFRRFSDAELLERQMALDSVTSGACLVCFAPRRIDCSGLFYGT